MPRLALSKSLGLVSGEYSVTDDVSVLYGPVATLFVSELRVCLTVSLERR